MGDVEMPFPCWWVLSGHTSCGFFLGDLVELGHVEVSSRAPTGPGHVAQPGRHEHERGFAVGEVPDDPRS